MKDALTYVNTLLLALAVAASCFLIIKAKSPADEAIAPPQAQPGPATAPQPDRSALAPLEQRLEAIEAALAKMSRAAEDRAAAPGTAAEQGGDAAAPGEAGLGDPAAASGPASAPGPGRALKQESVREIVREVLRQEEEERKKKAEENQDSKDSSGKPKKTISEVAKDLGLTMDQEQKLRDLHRDMSNELMKVLFEVPDDEGLIHLKAKLKEAEYNPETKAQLAEKLVYNWAMSQQKVTAVLLRAWTRTSAFMSPDQIKALDKYDLQQEKPEWPDIEKMFFPKEEKKPKEEGK